VSGIVLAGIVAAVVAAAAGPSTTVICGRGGLLDRIAQFATRFYGGGVIDGATANYCVVPSTAAWLLATVLLLAFCALAITVRRRAGDSRRAGPVDAPAAAH
jgi:hypothetical protein